MNNITEHVDLIECCQEETINEISRRRAPPAGG